MSNLFNPENKLMQLGTKLTDLMILNFLTLLCCLPVITIGASLTAMHSVLLKIYRGDDGYVTKDFFSAFRQNFKQSTLLLLLYALVGVFLATDLLLIGKEVITVPQAVRYILWGICVLVMLSYTWIFPLQSRYENKIGMTIKNAFFLCFSKLLYTVIMALLDLLPLVAVYYYEPLLLAVLLLGFTAPGFLKAMLYSKVFTHLESPERTGAQAPALEESAP